MTNTEIVKNVLLIVGGLAAFLVGMELLQQATEKLATGSLKKLFSKTSKNPFFGLGIGTLATMIMQSSGATTVMVVGFVNAGAMSLAQATSYIMGANIGTTITAQIVALGDLPISQVMIALTMIGVILQQIFAKKKEKIADVGSLIIGLGLLFLGLEIMTSYMKSLINGIPQIQEFLTSVSNPFLLLLIGILTTAAVQSSSAITSIVIALTMAGATIGGGGNAVLFLILGTNIGSTSTALLSSIGSTVNGKRAAVIHLLFNFFGSILFFIVLMCVPKFNDMTFAKWFKDSPQEQIAMFHTFFNVICTIIFFPFIKVFVKLATLIVPEKKDESNNVDEIIDERFLKNTAIAYSQSLLYYHRISSIAFKDLNYAIDAFINKDTSKKKEIDAIEEEVLRMSRKLNEYIVKIISLGVTEDINTRLSKMQLDIADIIRLTEVADNITGYTNHVVNDNLEFSDVVNQQLRHMQLLLDKQFKNTECIVEKPTMFLLLEAQKIENEIDDQRTLMIKQHMDRLSKGECKPQNSNIFVNLVGNLERCGDHFNFICERSCSTISKQTSAHA